MKQNMAWIIWRRPGCSLPGEWHVGNCIPRERANWHRERAAADGLQLVVVIRFKTKDWMSPSTRRKVEKAERKYFQ